ncbi:2-methoxy-6-polyprenyl-1,4-benzoquinol methylase, mitochondrial [Paenibacillus solanacearum]|uniref:2-methoxy-6-polyprenyl-1,4-benzoquinol methylase, mitochondrial n=1 Tax=Paenibacillus solanacearum TaxID=2048548 RepID=A0A916K4R2_9BACL|nr:class I SAM-dependent methyltransferase [Paenibacillus solanacearum]CAG7644378.1 2-methoxy-6-polyprenyl-1,4-benzoquinol methylase, mitochondrial [Paenibacillus solanacearum]
MIPEGNLKNNIDRFTGYGDVYDKNRPQAPQALVQVLTSYAGGKPSLVLDIGCGTGLSSFVWKDHAEQVIGVEPNADMIGKAQDNLRRSGLSHISFAQGYSNQLDAASGSVDIVTCSQSFHWMEPESTLREVARVLREGGVFAAYDCDWPPTIHWSIEEAYERLVSKADVIIARLAHEDDRAIKRDKSQHLANLRKSGVFRYCKEILFHNIERFDAERYVGLALSQGGVQTVFKLGSSELDEDIEAFRTLVAQYFNGSAMDVLFSYRMRVGVK